MAAIQTVANEHKLFLREIQKQITHSRHDLQRLSPTRVPAFL